MEFHTLGNRQTTSKLPSTSNLAAADAFANAKGFSKQMKLREALALLNEAERLGYEADSCAAARWSCHMLLGDFEAAWRESDAIAHRGNSDPHRFWNGEPLYGKRI